MFIAVMNQDMAADPAYQQVLADAGIQSPVSIEHSPFPCNRCGDACWIGPKQKLVATLQGFEVICYRCIFANPYLKSMTLYALNPEIEDTPRRLPS